MMLDGAPCDERGVPLPDSEVIAVRPGLRDWGEATADSPGCLFYAVGVDGADVAKLRALAPESSMLLPDFPFRKHLVGWRRRAPRGSGRARPRTSTGVDADHRGAGATAQRTRGWGRVTGPAWGPWPFVAGASVQGRDHRAVGRENQDAFGARVCAGGQVLVLAVSDGADLPARRARLAHRGGLGGLARSVTACPARTARPANGSPG